MRRLILATLVLILTALMATPAHATQPITDPVTGKQLVFHNHVDTAHIMWDEPANTFDIGVVIGSTVHPAEPYAMRLGPDADRTGREVSRIRLPENGMLNFLGSPGDVLWNAPARYSAGWPPLWAGLGTSSDIPQHINPRSIELNLVEVEGPDRVVIWIGDANGASPVMDSASTTERSIRMPPGAHTHINWTFFQPGRYNLTWQATAVTNDGQPVTGRKVSVPWLVGHDTDLGLPDGTTPANKITIPADTVPTTAPTAPTSTPTVDPSAGSATPPSAEHAICLAPGHIDFATTLDSDGAIRSHIHDTTNPRTPRDIRNYRAVIPVPDSTKFTLPDSPSFNALRVAGPPGTTLWTLPQIQQEDLVWPGFSTENFDYSKVKDGVTTSISSVEGPGRFLAWQSDSIDGARVLLDSGDPVPVITSVERTHMHTAMSFTAPGLYYVDFNNRTTFTNGESDYAYTGAYFAVGDTTISSVCPQLAPTTTTPVTTTPGTTAPEPTPEKPAGSSLGSNLLQYLPSFVFGIVGLATLIYALFGK
ncbi:hypothetical protein HCH15_06060 [Corynebacterium testudinoris]|uniref:Actinobacterial surface-anchored protein domain n=1 Tax=Corynebacterium testudinoris TaxID=136857 RepID=A0A0G3H4H5_9CORY|nr:choice-of-anchor M domain-containing protein [Corynebacterium testudinoris]AKK08304.1 actinobacterial surface-anchored protein domain [Corynebacterium testudinoris]MBX8995745.1 hypothetical protein [Corynebacterium testudinoris]